MSPAVGTQPAPGYGNVSRHDGPLSGIRICDLSGQLAGAGSTRLLAAFGAQVIRVEDPVTKGLWDIVRQLGPHLHDDRSPEGGAGFNNHNVEKLGVTINLRTEAGKDLLRQLVRVSDAVTENFAAGVMERLGFGYDDLRKLKADIVYVSNCGFGQTGPYAKFKSWGPIAQAVSGLTWSSGLPDREPAGWGYSYMDHTGGYVMAIALLAALRHQRRTGEGQWVDLSCSEAGIALNGPTLLDATVNGRRLRGPGRPNSNRSAWPEMAPHGIYPASEEDSWVAVACRHDDDWRALADAIGEPWADPAAPLAARLADQDALDDYMVAWTSRQPREKVVAVVRGAGVPCAPVARPPERCDDDPDTAAWGLWPEVEHTRHGTLRVDGLPVHLSRGDWHLQHGGPLLGEHNERVFGEVLGLTETEIAELRREGAI
jgi:benzylsuccinate CoA-transferase BbsF subunit